MSMLKKLLSFRNNNTPKNTVNGGQQPQDQQNTATSQKGSFFKSSGSSTPRGSKATPANNNNSNNNNALTTSTGGGTGGNFVKYTAFEVYQLGATEYYASHKNLYDFPPQIFVGGDPSPDTNSLLCFNPVLSTLILDFNNISVIPDSITLLSGLRHLSLAANQLADVPECITKLKLVTLELGLNRLTAFPIHVCGITSLSTLYIESNNLTSIPEEIGQLVNLRVLSLTGNSLTSIPSVLPPALEVLNLSCNDITETVSPALVSVATTLTTLNLAENAISSLDIPCFTQLRQLRTLVLDCNMIGELQGDMVSGWESMVTLNIPHNLLTSLPPQIALLTNLKVLDVRGNRFEFVKKESPEESSFYKFRIDNFINDKEALEQLLKSKQQKLEPSCNISVTSTTPPISELSLDDNNNKEEEEELSSSLRSSKNNNNNIEDTPKIILPTPIIITSNSIDDNAKVVNNNDNDNNNNNDNDKSSTNIVPTITTTTTTTNESKNEEKNESPQKLIIWQSVVPDLIIDRLYLGCRECSINKNWLRDHNITHILTIAHFKPLYNNLFKYKCIDIDDVDEAPIGKYFKEMNEFIEQGRKEGGVLIHCRAGVSRSASATIAYIMYQNNITFQEAFDITCKGRPRICPNRGFVEQLKQFEQTIIPPPPQPNNIKTSSNSINTSTGSLKE